MIPVKICGLMREEDMVLCADEGAAALGLVVEYPAPVPWNLTAERASALRQAAPKGVTVCMVTGGAPDVILQRAKTVRPHMVQLHHEETLEETAYITKALAGQGIAVIKALRVDGAGTLRFEIADPAEAAHKLTLAGVAALLMDSVTPQRPGGSGQVVDMQTYRVVAAASGLPVILAGGLTGQNLRDVVPADAPPNAIDVLSGVESALGEKDRAKVRALLEAANTLPKRSGQLWN